MPINPVSFYFKQFEKNRELPGVEKRPLSPRERDGIIDSLEMNFRNAMSRDNQPDDMDPVAGHVLSATTKGVSSATYAQDEQGKHLRIASGEGSRRFLSEGHLSEGGMDLISYTSTPGWGNTLLCYHCDLTQPDKDFVQHLDLNRSLLS